MLPACLMLRLAAFTRRLAALVMAGAAAFGAAAQPAVPATSPSPLLDCHAIRDLAFVAHLDDDLLFMNPDLMDNIQAGGCVRVVYLTASDAGEGEPYMFGRERGVRAAYAYMARQDDNWREDSVQVGAHSITRYTLSGNPRVELLHLRLKDPWLGPGWGSLTPLSRTESQLGQHAEALGALGGSYSRAELVTTLATLVRDYRPSNVRHLDDTVSVPYDQLCWRCAGHSHPDHIASARLVREALAQAPGNYAETGYVDYPSQERSANLSDAEIAGKTEVFRRYAWQDHHYCKDAASCHEPAGPAAAWVQRAYYVSRHDAAPELLADAHGGLTLAAAGETNDAVNLWDAADQRWRILGGRVSGPLAAYVSGDGHAELFARDALGHLWLGRRDRDGHWLPWRDTGGGLFVQAPVLSAQGPGAAVALGHDGRYHGTTRSGASWSAWQALPDLAEATRQVAITQDAAGRSWVLALDRAGAVHASWQTPGGPWQPWQALALPAVDGGLAALGDAQGRIDLYARAAASGQLLRVALTLDLQGQVQASAPAELGIRYAGTPAAASDTRGHVALALFDPAAAAIWVLEDGRAVRTIDGAASLPALRYVDGTLHVAARVAGAAQHYRVLRRQDDGWTPVTGLVSTALAELPADGGSAFAAAPAWQDDPVLAAAPAVPTSTVATSTVATPPVATPVAAAPATDTQAPMLQARR